MVPPRARARAAAWGAAGVLLLACCLAGLLLGRRASHRTTLQAIWQSDRGALGQRLRWRTAQLAQLQTPEAAKAVAAALKREVEQMGGARSPAMGVLQHVMRDMSVRREEAMRSKAPPTDPTVPRFGDSWQGSALGGMSEEVEGIAPPTPGESWQGKARVQQLTRIDKIDPAADLNPYWSPGWIYDEYSNYNPLKSGESQIVEAGALNRKVGFNTWEGETNSEAPPIRGGRYGTSNAMDATEMPQGLMFKGSKTAMLKSHAGFPLPSLEQMNGCACEQTQLRVGQRLRPDAAAGRSVGQSLGSRDAAQAACGCGPRARPIPPPRLVNGDDCDDLSLEDTRETRGVRWLIDCPSKWVPVRRPAPPLAKPEEKETYTVGPEVGQTYADALEAPPGEEEPEIEKDEMGPLPDIFSPQEPWHARDRARAAGKTLKDYRNEWYFDYEAAPYTGQYDDESEHDQFSPEEPWNDRARAVVLDGTLADLQRLCLRAGEDHMWDAERHECLYKGKASWPEMPRGRGVTQEGPSRKALDGETPLGDVIDDAKELDEFGVRRPEPAGEVDQFGWRPAEPVRPRDTTLDYLTVDLEKACRAQMQIPGKGRAYSWDPAQGKCLYMGRPAREEEEASQTTHPLTDGIFADLKRECLTRGGEWQYPEEDGQPGVCDESERR
jgi:hypothetical protein